LVLGVDVKLLTNPVFLADDISAEAQHLEQNDRWIPGRHEISRAGIATQFNSFARYAEMRCGQWRDRASPGGITMKRKADLWLTGALVAIVTITSAWAQEQDALTRYAREKRQQKQSQPAPKKVFDNDNLPREEHISVVGNPPTDTTAGDNAEPTNSGEKNADGSTPAAQPKDATAGNTDKVDPSKTKLDVTPGQSADDRQKSYDAWKKRIADQKEAVDLASRELDVMQREYRLRAAAVYADAGNRLRNAATWDKEDKQYKDQIAAKQKAVDAAKQQLADLQEQARRSGVPANNR
jgi:hypothetical protein